MSSDQPKKILFFLNHPAHYHLFKNIINRLISDGFAVHVLIVSKDVLESLVKQEKWDYFNLFPEGRRIKGLPIILNTFVSLCKTEWRLLKYISRKRPDIMVGTEGTLAHTGFLLNIPYFLFNEDDTSATPENYVFYPFAAKLVMPYCCDPGNWKKKRISYYGYHELAYLHPQYFQPKEDAVRAFNPSMQRYFIIRLAELSASHDVGKKGITDDLARKLIEILERHGRVFITSERPLKEEFEKYRLSINPKDIFHAMYYADLYIGDSQTMAAEGAVLGTPTIRFNDFVRRLGYLDELEDKYGLTFGIKTSEVNRLFSKVEELLNTPNLKERWSNKRKVLLVENADLVGLALNIIKSHFSKDNLKQNTGRALNVS